MRKSQQGFIVPGIGQLAIIAVIVALIFGTKKLVAVGGDIGGMFKGIRNGFREATQAADELGPEVRGAIEDVKRLHQAGAEFTGRSVQPYQRQPSFDDREEDNG